MRKVKKIIQSVYTHFRCLDAFSALVVVLTLLSLSSSLNRVYADSRDHIFFKLKQQAEESKQEETVYLDNAFIQIYKARIGLWHFVKSSFSLSVLMKKYGVQMKEVAQINEWSPNAGFQGWLFLPYSKEYHQAYQKTGVSRQSVKVLKGEFIWPIFGSRITSRLGKRWGVNHRGLDVATGIGGIVLAAQTGRVTKAGAHGGYGNTVFLQHEQGYRTVYAHLSTTLVKEGDYVEKGQVIALSGNSGRSTGPHLHFEIECGGIPLNPENFLPNFEESMETTSGFSMYMHSKLNIHN